LGDAVDASQSHNGTYLGKALNESREEYARIIVPTDEQAHDRVPGPRGRAYVINVASFNNGVSYGAWTHIDGHSHSRARAQKHKQKRARDQVPRPFLLSLSLCG
jgi:60 kDa SS-A/Ro ribonucleoprotein